MYRNLWKRWKDLPLHGSAKAHLMEHGLGACSGTFQPLAPLHGSEVRTVRGYGHFTLTTHSGRSRSCGLIRCTAPGVPRGLRFLDLLGLLRFGVFLVFFLFLIFFFFVFLLFRGLLGLGFLF